MTSEAKIEKRITEILATDFEADASAITPDTNLYTDLMLDSIDAIDLVVRIQNETGKRVEPSEFREIRTMRDLVAAVARIVNS